MIESFTAKEENGLTSFLILDVLDITFWKGTMSEEMVIHRQHTEMFAIW